jgi:hypothetical protein
MKRAIHETVQNIVDRLPDELIEAWQERAAIREYDGGVLEAARRGAGAARPARRRPGRHQRAAGGTDRRRRRAALLRRVVRGTAARARGEPGRRDRGAAVRRVGSMKSSADWPSSSSPPEHHLFNNWEKLKMKPRNPSLRPRTS